MEFSIGQVKFVVGLAQTKDGKKTLRATITIPMDDKQELAVSVFYQESAKVLSVELQMEDKDHEEESAK